MLRRVVFSCLVCLFACGTYAHVDNPLSKDGAEAVRKKVASEWLDSVRNTYGAAWTARSITIDGRTMPFYVKVFGRKPDGGYPMYISLHGGGNCPAVVNDDQWENQKLLYAPANSVYVVPRAPYDDWDMWFKPLLDSFYRALIDIGVAFADVNPDRIYLMGYSAGGDGVWRMAPRMADAWAAASMMAGHPGDVSLVNLRNTPFMIWCGAEDSAYDRNVLDAKRGVQMDSLHRSDPEGYIHETHIMPGKGHWMDRADTVAVSWMRKYVRNPYPKRIVWRQEAVLRPSFYWISVPEKEMERGKTVRLAVAKNTIDITECDYSELTLWLNDNIVDLDKNVKVRFNGKTIYRGKAMRTEKNLHDTQFSRNDLRFAFPSKIVLHIRG